ncbi:hypothetical protein C8J57DRAFT_1721378 [Mycena rebaudengoi]|nr:hypothetical protein C8J57DRAFT_1721378 [Mycena rebaudengoi]
MSGITRLRQNGACTEPTIPREIVDAIVGEIDRFDVPALKPCALAARALLPESQKLIFWSISLDPQVTHIGSTGTVKTGHALFSKCPHLAPYVKCLYVKAFLRDSLPDQRLLVDILRWLPNVERLRVHGDLCDWSSLLPDLTSEIYLCLNRYPLKALDLANFNDHNKAEEMGTGLRLPNPPRLHALSVGDSDSFDLLPDPRSSRCIDQVQTLMINILNLHRGQMISAVAKCLRHLVLEVQVSYLIVGPNYMPQLLTLAPDPPLRNLTFRNFTSCILINLLSMEYIRYRATIVEIRTSTPAKLTEYY